MLIGKNVRINKSGCLGRCDEGIVCAAYPNNEWVVEAKPSDVLEIEAWILGLAGMVSSKSWSAYLYLCNISKYFLRVETFMLFLDAYEKTITRYSFIIALFLSSVCWPGGDSFPGRGWELDME